MTIFISPSDLERSSRLPRRCLSHLSICPEVRSSSQRGFAINSIPGFWLARMAKSPNIHSQERGRCPEPATTATNACTGLGKEPAGPNGIPYFAANISIVDTTSEGAYKPCLYKMKGTAIAPSEANTTPAG